MDQGKTNFTAALLAAGQQNGDKIALATLSLSGAQRWSYQRLEATILAAAQWLAAQGLAPNAQVFCTHSDPVLNTILKLAAIGAGLVVVDCDHGVVPDLSTTVVILAPGQEADVPSSRRLDADAKLWQTEDLVPLAVLAADQAAYIHYGADGSCQSHSHADLWGRLCQVFHPELSDRVFHAAAFTQGDDWLYGLAAIWAVGATGLIAGPKVNLAQVMLLLRRHDATILIAQAEQFAQIIQANQNPTPLPKLRYGLGWRETVAQNLRQLWQDQTSSPLIDVLAQMRSHDSVDLL